MGSSQSSRTLTVSNDDNTRVITLSASLAERLAHGAQEATENKTSASKISSSPAQVAPSNSPAPPSAAAAPRVYYSAPGYTMSALEMQQQKEQEIATQEQYWQKRVHAMEQNHAHIDQLFEEEYNKAIEEFTHTKGKQDQIRGKITPCLESSEQVLKCYQDHPRETLKCADLVERFSNCVDQRRARVIAARS